MSGPGSPQPAMRARQFVDALRWVLSVTWTTSPILVVTAIGLSLARSTVAAGLAVTARGLINAVVAESHHGQGQLRPLLPWLLAALGFGFVEVLAPLGSARAVRRLADALQFRVTVEVLRHASRLTSTETEDPRRRGLLENARDSSGRRLGQLVDDLLSIVSDVAQCFLLAAVLVHIEPMTLAIVVPGAAAYLYAEWRMTCLLHASAPTRALRQRWARYFADLLTSSRSASHVRLLGLAPTLIDRFLGLMRQLEDSDRARARRQYTTGATFGLVTTLLLCALLGLVASRAIDGRLTVGDIAVFAAASPRLRSTLNRLVLAIVRSVDAILATDAIQTFLAIPSQQARSRSAWSTPLRSGVEVENVWFTYPGATEPALAGVSLSIRPGEILALAGGNGAGKTTLVKLLAGFYTPQKGRILLDGRDLREWPFEVLRERLMLVSPDSPRFEATARDNVAFGHWPELAEAPEAVQRLAEDAGVHRLLRELPRGYETMLGHLFGEHDLSSGEWQQVMLARALARPASLWLLDEPTAHVDERAERHQLDRLRALASGRSILLASHRPRPLALAERIVILERGRVVEAGERNELLLRGGRYARLVAAQGL
jgi:ATP-binding cassette subfamily B protein